jgi:pyruvate formate lyase activating enzyme
MCTQKVPAMEKEEPMSRREFIKRALLIGAGVAVGVYGISRIVQKSNTHTDDTDRSELGTEEPWKWSKEGYHYIQLQDTVKCQVCPNQCIIREGGRSVCGNKTNYQGVLYTLAYGNPCAVHIDPIEKKPLFHFLPTSTALSIATAGCNLSCLNCQNWQISQKRPEETSNGELFPEQVVEVAQRENCQSIAYTYSEPTAWYEYMYDTARIAADHGIKNVWITNGYMNEEPLKDLCQYLDAANVDLKSFSDEIYHKLNSGTLEPVLHTLKVLKEEGVWVEVTNLVVPTWTDDMEMIADMCQWLYENLGPDYPVHFSRFHPDYKLQNLPPTPVKTLQEARNIGLDSGLHYVYMGNVPGAQEENTYCPQCNELIVGRKGFTVTDMHVVDGVCEYCGQKIAGVWS